MSLDLVVSIFIFLYSKTIKLEILNAEVIQIEAFNIYPTEQMALNVKIFGLEISGFKNI